VVAEARSGASPEVRVLVVEDDSTVAEVVVRYLEREGFAAEWVADGNAALESAERELPDLVVLDIMLPGVDGLEVCRRLRNKAPIPIIMLTALGEESDRVLGLDLGADDYVSKPFSVRELMARIKSVLRRARQPLAGTSVSAQPLVYGDLSLDLNAREARIAGTPVTLTVREFELLAFMATHPRHAFTRDDLLERVWGYKFGDTSTVTVHVRRLREKIEADPARPRLIKTVWGVGYRFEGQPT
jgi:DNA-binding response OmpR family regulator